MDKKELGDKIRRLRENAGMTQNALANRAGVSPTYIYQLEQGLKSPTVEYLGYICDGLGVTLADFFRKTRADEYSLKNLNEQQKALFDSFLKSLQ